MTAFQPCQQKYTPILLGFDKIPATPTQAMERLHRATQTPYHAFWPCEVSLLDEKVVDRTRIHGSRQVTDVYLLALAVAKGGRFVTLDRSIPLSAVAGARPENLVIL